MAFIGVRSCDLHAIAKLDRVFIGGRYVNPEYEARRGRVFVVAVNCGVAAKTCFCVSMNTGPRATFGYDIALTELLEDGRREYLAEAATERGAELLAALPGREAAAEDVEAGERVVERTAASMGRQLDTEGCRAARREPRPPALGRGRRALPHLRELHDGLPDPLLHDGRGRHRPDRNRGRTAPGVGLVLHARLSPTCTAAASAPRRAAATGTG